jgi:hypothetical protein
LPFCSIILPYILGDNKIIIFVSGTFSQWSADGFFVATSVKQLAANVVGGDRVPEQLVARGKAQRRAQRLVPEPAVGGGGTRSVVAGCLN